MLNQVIHIFDWAILLVFAACFCYQAIYFFTRFSRWKKAPDAKEEKTFAVLIAARNEENVIGNLIDSIHAQNYDQTKLTVYVVADNCTDNTANVARAHGAVCYERFNCQQTGKCYALQYLFQRLMVSKEEEKYDGYFIFDADNLLDKNFVREMNNTFCQGYPVVAGYRNSKNISDNWISYGYGLWFLHESGFLNRGRSKIGSSAMVSGTGYLIGADIIREHGGWNWFLMTEDIEFTTNCMLEDKKIGFCETAIYYDEQPTRLKESFTQRIRWVKGYYQVFGKYGKKLVAKLLRNHSFCCFDMIMSYVPALLLSLGMCAGYLLLLLGGLLTGQDVHWLLYCMGTTFVKTYLGILALGVYTIFTERRHIDCSPTRQIGYLLLFPLYMFTYYPIAFAAMRKDVKWAPIRHGNQQTHWVGERQTTKI